MNASEMEVIRRCLDEQRKTVAKVATHLSLEPREPAVIRLAIRAGAELVGSLPHFAKLETALDRHVSAAEISAALSPSRALLAEVQQHICELEGLRALIEMQPAPRSGEGWPDALH